MKLNHPGIYRVIGEQFELLANIVGEVPCLRITSALLINDLVQKGKNAGSIVREASKLIQGSGGGQPFFATAGGKDTEAIQEAILKAKELIFA